VHGGGVAAGQLDLGRARLQDGLQHQRAHRLGGGREAAAQDAGGGDHLLFGQAHVDEAA
jgi:hypothetical protein